MDFIAMLGAIFQPLTLEKRAIRTSAFIRSDYFQSSCHGFSYDNVHFRVLFPKLISNPKPVR